jgi:hypothetical protein
VAFNTADGATSCANGDIVAPVHESSANARKLAEGRPVHLEAMFADFSEEAMAKDDGSMALVFRDLCKQVGNSAVSAADQQQKLVRPSFPYVFLCPMSSSPCPGQLLGGQVLTG